MPLYVALLRGINVGGHVVKMQALREVFESLRFRNVETVIASGNVVFESSAIPKAGGARGLEEKIEAALKTALGYEVATFLRTPPELAEIVRRRPFDLALEPPGAVVYALFLRNRPAPSLAEAVRSLETGNDEARVGAREIYWLRRERGKDSDVFGTRLGKLLGSETTARNMNTVRKIAEKYGRPGPADPAS